MRFRDEKPGDAERARAVVAAWRDANPAGTEEQLLAEVAPQFRPEWAVVLRCTLFAVDRHRSRVVTGIVTGQAGAAR
jgi:hypothetical protein